MQDDHDSARAAWSFMESSCNHYSSLYTFVPSNRIQPAFETEDLENNTSKMTFLVSWSCYSTECLSCRNYTRKSISQARVFGHLKDLPRNSGNILTCLFWDPTAATTVSLIALQIPGHSLTFELTFGRDPAVHRFQWLFLHIGDIRNTAKNMTSANMTSANMP